MPLIKDRTVVEDRWTALDDEAPIPAEGPVIVSADRWQAEREALLNRRDPLGVRLRSDQPPATIEADIGRFSVIALEFPKFNDGRAYSYARLLRERYGFKGELRAGGNVLRDQLLFMARCGFDAYEVPAEASLDAWLKSFDELSVWLQDTGDGRAPAWRLRHRSGGNGPGACGPAAESNAPEGTGKAPAPTWSAARARWLGTSAAEPCTAHWAY